MPSQYLGAARGASHDALRVVRFAWSHPANRSRRLRALVANIALNGYDVTVLGVALARRRGTMRFIPGRDNLSQLLFDHSLGTGVATCEVPVDTLDGARRALGERRIGLVQLANWGAVEQLGEDGTSVADLLASAPPRA